MITTKLLQVPSDSCIGWIGIGWSAIPSWIPERCKAGRSPSRSSSYAGQRGGRGAPNGASLRGGRL